MSGPEQSELSQSAVEVINLLKQRNLSIGTVEATTGGLIGHLFTSVAGSSGVFRAGVAPYSNDAKQRLGISKETLEEFGAVSAEAAQSMADVIRSWAWVDIGVAETGIAGPTGGSEDRPVGSFWIAVVTPGGATVERLEFPNDREGNMRACAAAALQMVLKAVR